MTRVSLKSTKLLINAYSRPHHVYVEAERNDLRGELEAAL
jgi:hypothetical protein